MSQKYRCRQSLSGKKTFEDKETLDEILSILQISAKYKMEKKRGEIYIY